MSNYKRMYLQGYNYVFFTIVTNNRENILIENIDLLRESFKNALENFTFNIISNGHRMDTVKVGIAYAFPTLPIFY